MRGDRPDAIPALSQKLEHGFVLDLRRLQIQETMDHLKIVLHAMMNFTQKNIFFFQG